MTKKLKSLELSLKKSCTRNLYPFDVPGIAGNMAFNQASSDKFNENDESIPIAIQKIGC